MQTKQEAKAGENATIIQVNGDFNQGLTGEDVRRISSEVIRRELDILASEAVNCLRRGWSSWPGGLLSPCRKRIVYCSGGLTSLLYSWRCTLFIVSMGKVAMRHWERGL